MPAKRKAALMDFSSTVSNGGVIGIFLANGPTGVGSSNQSGDYPAQIAIKTPKANPHSLPRQRDIRRALIEADLVDTALRDSTFPQTNTTPQVLSAAKDNMVGLPASYSSARRFQTASGPSRKIKPPMSNAGSATGLRWRSNLLFPHFKI